MRFVKGLLFTACLLPFLYLVWAAFYGGLGANPVETITHETGNWTLRFILLTLLITPLRRLTGWKPVLRYRRLLGLYAFFYACLHFLTWVWLDQGFAWEALLEDVLKRPYITVGFGAFLLLIPLAVTSNKFSMRRLGKRWKALHQLVYVIAVLGTLHFLWLVKADLAEPVLYGVILLLLLIARTPLLAAGRLKGRDLARSSR